MNTPEEIEAILAANTYAVFGVSRSQGKYGYQVYSRLKRESKTAYPVNPTTTDIDGDRCYAGVNDLPDDVEAAVLIVQPSVSEEVVTQCLAKGIRRIWMQPGAESARAIAICEEAGAALVAGGPCIMVMLPQRNMRK